MAMSMINKERLQEVCQDCIGYIPPTEEALSEMIRCELWARQVSSRRFLCTWITSSAQPLGELSVGDIHPVLDEMGRAGDITNGPRGKIAAAPIRLVKIGGSRYRIFGTIPNRLIKNYFPEVTSIGINREINFESDEQCNPLLNQYGGLLMSVNRWAGFERTIPAGPEWLEQLDEHLSANGVNPGSYDDKLVGEWSVYKPATQNKKKKGGQWKITGSSESGRLWRGWSSFKRPMHFWTEGGSPSSVRSVRLSMDEASRALFSLALEAKTPIEFTTSSLGTHMVLEYDTYLPLAEYRYLITICDQYKAPDKSRVFKIPIEIWPQVESKLKERLGVIFESKGV